MISLPLQKAVISGGIPTVIFSFLGSRQLSVGPNPSTYIMMADVIDSEYFKNKKEKIEYITCLTFLISCFLVIFGLIRTKFVGKFY